MKNVAKYKNKIFGVCTIFASIFIFAPLIAHGADVFTYTRTPSGNGEYKSVSISLSIDDVYTQDFYLNGENHENWDLCDLYFELESGQFSYSTFGISNTINESWELNSNVSAYFEETREIKALGITCYQSSAPESFGQLVLEDGNGSNIFTIIPETQTSSSTYGTMFGSGSSGDLVANTSNFMQNSGIMPIAIAFIAIVLGFYILELLISIISRNRKIDQEIKEEFPTSTKEERKLIRKEREYKKRFKTTLKGGDKISTED